MRIGTIYDSLNEAFSQLKDAVHGSSAFIKIPRKANGDYRICEQEYKWLFIQSFIGNKDNTTLSFSLEDPTINGYVFSTKSTNKNAFTFCEHSKKSDKQYRSANIDLSLYESDSRIAIMEFKAGNPGSFYHAKDFFKLANEPGNILRYFVEIYERTDAKTIESIKIKLFNNKYFNLNNNTQYIGYSLCHNENPNGARFSCDSNNQDIIIHIFTD